MTIFTETGIMTEGDEVANFHLVIEKRRYSEDGWYLDLIGKINGVDLPFSVPESQLKKPAEWLKRLGPDARLDEKYTDILVAAATEMSQPGFKLVPRSGYHQEADGLYWNGKQLTDFTVTNVTTVKPREFTEVSVETVQAIGTPTRSIEVRTLRNGQARVSRVNTGDLVGGMAAVLIGGQIYSNISFAMYVNSRLNAQPVA